MKNCWKILRYRGETTDVDIRRAYLRCYCPFFIQKPIRRVLNNFVRAHEEALRIAQSLINLLQQPEEYEVAEHEILLAFRALRSSDSERFSPSTAAIHSAIKLLLDGEIRADHAGRCA